MGFRSVHHRRNRLLCRLVAAFWGLTTLLGAAQPALCALNHAALSDTSSASRALCRCPMCGHLHRVGMKCCCCPSGSKMAQRGQMTLCAACPTGRGHTVAALDWSDPAWLHPAPTLTLPPLGLERLARQALALRFVSVTLFPRPPCLR